MLIIHQVLAWHHRPLSLGALDLSEVHLVLVFGHLAHLVARQTNHCNTAN